VRITSVWPGSCSSLGKTTRTCWRHWGRGEGAWGGEGATEKAGGDQLAVRQGVREEEGGFLLGQRKLEEWRAENETRGRPVEKLVEAWDLGRLQKDSDVESLG
jgi:hypothetical protein